MFVSHLSGPQLALLPFVKSFGGAGGILHLARGVETHVFLILLLAVNSHIASQAVNIWQLMPPIQVLSLYIYVSRLLLEVDLRGDLAISGSHTSPVR